MILPPRSHSSIGPRPWVGVLAVVIACACGREEGPRAEEHATREDLALRVAELQQELQAERGAYQVEQADWAAERARFEEAIVSERSSRYERELQWLRYVQGVAALKPDALPTDRHFDIALPFAAEPSGSAASTASAPQKSAEELAAEQERAALRRSLRNLLAIEEVSGLDLLEVGHVHEGWTGPIVFRLLDGTGRLAGSLYAERMRLEGSRTGRTVTLVFEDGYESRGGERHPFEGGAPETGLGGLRRIRLPGVDPQPWIEAAPKLFGEIAQSEPEDDGSFDLALVRSGLNELLREDASAGYYRVKELGGVVSGAMCKVHLERYDRDGKLERRLFADRMRVLAEGDSVQIVLEDGVQVRGDEKVPFLDGRFRIFLPRAKAEAWRQAGIPGLAQPPPRAEAPVPDAGVSAAAAARREDPR